MTMKYVQINAFSDSWAKQIVFKKHEELLARGDESWVFWGKGDVGDGDRLRRIQTVSGYYLDAFQTKVIDGKIGFHSKRATRRLLSWLEEIDPDVVHLHSLIGYYLNVEMLFGWLAAHRCKVVWTLHDCWAFTGHCLYFTYVGCDQWRACCGRERSCPQPDAYIRTLRRGMEEWNFEQKRRIFTQLSPERVQLITPSEWLAGLVRRSFLSKYNVMVVHNTVDTSIFMPKPSDFRERYGLGTRFVVLGVASKWTERKGLHDFVRLAKELDSERFAVVVVGLTKKQLRQVKREAKAIVALPRTENGGQLAEAYTASDVLLNPSAEETFGMNVAEAAACGTGSIVVEGSACAEVADPDKTSIVPVGLEGLEATIVNLAGGGLMVLISRTESVGQLAAVYTAADVLFNPTREDNYPTVNLEAQACGTPVWTYGTGGCAETLTLPDSAVCRSADDLARHAKTSAVA